MKKWKYKNKGDIYWELKIVLIKSNIIINYCPLKIFKKEWYNKSKI